ncbi:MAG: YfhO family protein [Thermoanaerobaculia bacterium]
MALMLYLLSTLLVLEIASRTILHIRWLDRWVLAALPLVEAGKALVRGRVLGPIDLAWLREPHASLRVAAGVELLSPRILYDQWCQIIPWRQAVRAAFAAGEWPLWNPFVLAGEPLLGAESPALFHPLHLVSLVLSLPMSVTFVAAATLGWSALWMYLLTRDLGVRPEVALFAAAAWTYGAFHLFWLGWPVALASSAMPLLVLSARRVARGPGPGSIALMAVAWGLLMLAGNPEVALLAGFLAGGVFLAELVLHSPDRRAALLAAVAGTALGLSLSAVQLLPFLDALPQTAEMAARHEDNGAGLVAADRATATSLLLENILPLALGVDPPGVRVQRTLEPSRAAVWTRPLGVDAPGGRAARSLEPARATSWIGAFGLAAALFGLFTASSRWRWMLAVVFLIGLGLSTYLPGVIDIARVLPGFSMLRPRYGALWASFAITLLAALGLESALRAKSRRGFLLACLAAAVVVAGAFVLVSPYFGERGITQHNALLGLAAALIPLALVAWGFAARPIAYWVMALAIGGLLVERQIEMGRYYVDFPVEQFFPAIPPLDELARHHEEGRFVALGQAIHPNTGTMWGLEDVRGYDPMALGRYVETFPIWAPGSFREINRVATLHPFLNFLNVRFALTSAPLGLLPGWKMLRQGPGWLLYENSAPLPRVFSPARSRIGGTSEERLRDLAGRTDFRALAWIEPERSGVADGEAANGPCDVDVARRGYGYRIAADCEKQGWLVTSIPAWRGWRASAGGTQLAGGIANHAFVAIHAPAGRSEIDLAFRPRSFYVGGALTLAGLLILTAIAVVRRRSWLPPGAAEGS